MSDRSKIGIHRYKVSRRTPWLDYQLKNRHRAAKQKRLRASRTKTKTRHRWRELTNFIIVFLELSVILWAGIYLISPLDHISRFKITGIQTIPNYRFSRELRIYPGHSLLHWLVNFNRYKRMTIKRNPQLKSVHFHLKHWNQIEVHGVEYHKVAYLRRDNKYYAVTSNNRRLGNRVYHFSNLSQVPVLFNFKFGPRLEHLLNQYQMISPGIKHDVNRIAYDPTSADPERLRLFMNDGNQVLIKISDLSSKIKYYPPISRSMKRNGVVNLEIGAYSYPFNHKR